jgi:hypothetical protein
MDHAAVGGGVSVEAEECAVLWCCGVLSGNASEDMEGFVPSRATTLVKLS